MAQLPRGIRNNNPGNIRKNPANKWQGLAAEQIDPSFCTFDSMPYGIRAMARLLINYQDKKEAQTLKELIGFWAPPVENNTIAYVNRVASHMRDELGASIDAITKINTHDYAQLRAMVEGMIEVENGVPWHTYITDAQMVKGLTLAGVEAPKKPLQQSRVIKGQQIVATALAGTTVADLAQQAVDVQGKLQPLIEYSDYIKYIFLGVALIGIVLTVWARLDDRRKGIN